MQRFLVLLAAGVIGLGALQAQALEGRVDAVLDPTSSDESSIGGLIGLGVPLSERLTVGGFGYLVTTDRDLPTEMSRLNALGVFAEFDLSEGYDLMPYIGARAGVLGASGASYGNTSLLAGTLGLKYHFTERLTAAFSVNYLWAGEDYFDYERKTQKVVGDPFYEADDTDVTLDLGIRWTF